MKYMNIIFSHVRHLFSVTRRSLDMIRVRATDPRPCPKCGKMYRSAHTLRTHLEDKHTVCPGYRCVLCGTVAKSRNSLHSHMSRQHRGISTKDLPVMPMPSKFDPELASRLLAKAGVKVSPAELRARASPTASRRSDMRLEPPRAGASEVDSCGGDDPEDLSLRYSSPLSNTVITKVSGNSNSSSCCIRLSPILYSQYELSHALSDDNLISSGEVACAIVGYTYNQIAFLSPN